MSSSAAKGTPSPSVAPLSVAGGERLLDAAILRLPPPPPPPPPLLLLLCECLEPSSEGWRAPCSSESPSMSSAIARPRATPMRCPSITRAKKAANTILNCVVTATVTGSRLAIAMYHKLLCTL